MRCEPPTAAVPRPRGHRYPHARRRLASGFRCAARCRRDAWLGSRRAGWARAARALLPLRGGRETLAVSTWCRCAADRGRAGTVTPWILRARVRPATGESRLTKKREARASPSTGPAFAGGSLSPGNSLLAGLAVGVVDGAELRILRRALARRRRCRCRCRRGAPGGHRAHAAARGHRVQLAAGAGGFLRRGRRERAQVVRGLQAPQPRELVGLVELLARGAGHVDVERLRLVDPLLPARARLDEPGRVHLESGGVEAAHLLRDAVDL